MHLGPHVLLPLLGLALAAAPLGWPAQAEIAGPPKVVDGDTIEVQGTAIRLYGIDAPELGQICRIGAHAYDCGKIARTALLDLTAGVSVTCKLVPPDPAGGEDSAQGGRPGLCSADGYDLSEGMAYTGWALAWRKVSERYVAYEDRARTARRGLWKGEFVAPWAWRAGARLPPAGVE